MTPKWLLGWLALWVHCAMWIRAYGCVRYSHHLSALCVGRDRDRETRGVGGGDLLTPCWIIEASVLLCSEWMDCNYPATHTQKMSGGNTWKSCNHQCWISQLASAKHLKVTALTTLLLSNTDGFASKKLQKASSSIGDRSQDLRVVRSYGPHALPAERNQFGMPQRSSW